MIATLEAQRQATTALRQTVAAQEAALDQDPRLIAEFLRYRAARQLFLPQHYTDEVAFFLDNRYNNELSTQLERHLTGALLLSQTTVEGDRAFVAQAGQQPFIFCTFHFGSYQSVGMQLRHDGFDFSVLTLREGITREMLHQSAAAVPDLDVLHADSPSVMLQMRNLLESGKSIMAFIDGNPDVITDADSKVYARVDLLGQSVLTKKGLPSLSYATGVPIIPIVSYRTGPESVRLAFGAPIWPDRRVTRAVFVQRTLQSCYDQLAHHLRLRPEQWIYWRIIHNYLDRTSLYGHEPTSETVAAPSHYAFNQARYELYAARTATYLYDRHSQDVFTISVPLATYLRHTTTRPEHAATVGRRLPAPLLTELIGKRVLRGVAAPISATPNPVLTPASPELAEALL